MNPPPVASLSESSQTQARLLEFTKALEDGAYDHLIEMLRGLPPADSAHLLESSPPKTRQIIWSLYSERHQSDILHYPSEDVLNELLSTKSPEELLHILENIDLDDLTDVLQQLPDKITGQVLNAMDMQNRTRVENLLRYPEDTAGGLMNTDTISVRPRFTLDVVFRYLRRHQELPVATDNIFVVNRSDEYVGVLPITDVVGFMSFLGLATLFYA